IEAALHFLVLDADIDEPQQVVDMDPRDPLIARAENHAHSRTRRASEAGQGAARASEHETESQAADSNAVLLRRLRRELPRLTQVRLKDRLAARRLGDFLVAADTVVADGGRVDEQRRLAI